MTHVLGDADATAVEVGVVEAAEGLVDVTTRAVLDDAGKCKHAAEGAPNAPLVRAVAADVGVDDRAGATGKVLEVLRGHA